MSKFTDEDHLVRANEARALLNNAAFNAALDEIETELITKWRECRVNPVELPIREGCHGMLKAVARLKSILQDYVDTGSIIVDKLDFLAETNKETITRDK